MKEDYFQKNPLFDDVYYLTKGYESCVPGHYFGPARREFYLIHIIEEGKGTFISKGMEYNLKAGQFFMIYPNETNYYKADEQDPWKYYWIGFGGKKVDGLLKSIGISLQTPIGNINNRKETISLMKNIIQSPNTDITSLITLQSYFYSLLAHLSVEHELYNNKRKPDIINKDIEYSNQAIQLIQDNYQDTDFSIREVSKKMALNSSYLSQVFKRTTGRTMNDYLIDYRIQKARKLLDTTQESIRDISESVGYVNPLSFTRVFKNVMKMTPREYRKTREHYKEKQ